MYNNQNKLFWKRVFDNYIVTVVVTLLVLQIKLTASVVSASSYDRNGRYSYSLTTFDPNGKLGQVERAIEASQLGSPIITVIYNTTNEFGIIMVAPQTLPNLLTIDDGTSRFTLISSNIMIAHSGLSSDGRILVSAAHKLAIQHEYTFDETIPIHILLEELSLLYQEYTMKVATRPFGTKLIVAYVPEKNNNKNTGNPQPALYQIDPSGNVELLDDCGIIHGREQLDKTDLVANLKVLMNDDTSITTIEECQCKVVKLVRDAFKQRDTKLYRTTNNHDDDAIFDDVTILTATLSRSISSSDDHMIQNEGIFRKQRYEPDLDCNIVKEQ